jgi:phosphoglycerate dehydrogenase-like enzyme
VRRGASGQVFLRVGDTVMRAVFHHPCDEWLRERITTFAGEDVSIEIVEEAAGPNIDRALDRADVLLHVLHPVTREMMARAPRLKLVQKIGVGLDAIDLDAARDQGIAVCNMPGTNSQAVAELALGLILAVLRRIPSDGSQAQVRRAVGPAGRGARVLRRDRGEGDRSGGLR